MHPYKYKAFISYSHKDEAFAKWLHKEIETYKIPNSLRAKYPNLPKDLKRTVFRDEEELSSAAILSEVLKDALENSEKLIVLCSPFSVDSFWVREEIEYFQKLHGEEQVLTLLLEGKIDEVVPSVLWEKDEPLLIDFKKKQAHQKSLLRVIATLLEVDFADLWRRELRVQRKKMLLQILSVVLVVLLGLFAYVQSFALSSNTEFNHISSEIRSLEHALKENLSEKEVYTLNERLRVLEEKKVLKEETLKWFGLLHTSVAKEAKKVYDKKGVEEALAVLESIDSLNEDKEYAQKNILRAKLYIEKGAFTKANDFYEKAVQVDDVYENMYEYARFLTKQKRLKKAEQLYEHLEKKPLRKEHRANVLNKLGILYRKRGETTRAEKVYKEALELREALLLVSPTLYQEDLAWTYNNMGVLYEELNRTRESEVAHFKALTLRKNLAQENEGETFHVACSLHNLGELYAGMKKQKRSETFYLKSLKIRRDLVAKNPKKYGYALAWTWYDLGELYVETKRYVEAERCYQASLNLRKKMVLQNPEAYTAVWANTLSSLAKLYVILERKQEAIVQYEALLTHYEGLGELYEEEQDEVHKILDTINKTEKDKKEKNNAT